MPADGGQPRRLTFLGATFCNVVGWTHDGRIVFRNRLRPAVHEDARAVSRSRPNRATANNRNCCRPARRASQASGRRASACISRRASMPAYWKRYRGGTAGDLWVDADEQRRLATARQARRQSLAAAVGRPTGFTSSAITTASAICTPARSTASRSPPPHEPRRLLRPPRQPPTAGGSSTTPGADLLLVRPGGEQAQGARRSPRITARARSATASSSTRRRVSRIVRAASQGPRLSPHHARQDRHARQLGRPRAATRRTHAGPIPTRGVAARWQATSSR